MPRSDDKVWQAWTSGNLGLMRKALPLKTSLLNRHFLLMSIVSVTYKQRTIPNMRQECREIAQLHVQEFNEIAPALKEDLGFMPRVSTFQHFATVLSEDERFDEAIRICRLAIDYGLSDGTKSDFLGRIARIEKMRRKKFNEPSNRSGR